MARRVYFAFHYQRDIFRVNQIRNSHIVEGCAAAGFQDGSIWEEAKRKGDAAIKALIDKGLINTTVTAVLIGAETYKREYVEYEIKQSIVRGNGLLGVYIDNMKDINGAVSARGFAPQALKDASSPLYVWDRDKFGDWVEQAAKKAGR